MPIAWPAPHDVHLSEPIGAFNTFVLICSSVTVVLGAGSGQAESGREGQRLDPADVPLGCVFLGVKMYEYSQKFAHGIYPLKPHGLVYDKADVYYSAAVRKRLERFENRVSRPTVAKLPTEEEQSSTVIDRIIARWSTTRMPRFATQPDSPEGRIKIMELAYAIYPPHDHATVEHAAASRRDSAQRIGDAAGGVSTERRRRRPARRKAASRTKASTKNTPGCGCRS